MIAFDVDTYTSLTDIGRARPVELSAARPRSSIGSYCIPRQGGGSRYYLLRLRAQVVLSDRGRQGTAYLTAQTGDDTSASIKLDVLRPAGKAGRVRLTTVGVDGVRRFRPARAPTVDFVNYVVFAAATPGRHRLRVRLEDGQGLGIKRIAVSRDSGFAVTQLSPDAWRRHLPPRVTPDLRFTRRQKQAVGGRRWPAVRCSVSKTAERQAEHRDDGRGPVVAALTLGGAGAAGLAGFTWLRRRQDVNR